MNRILWNERPGPDDDGNIDEIVVEHPAMVHIEQMDDRCWWIAIYFDSDRYWTGNFTADTRGRLRFVEQDAAVEWDRDETHEPDHCPYCLQPAADHPENVDGERVCFASRSAGRSR